MNYTQEKAYTAEIMRRLYARNLTTCSGGNISMRVSPERILITPSSLDKGTLDGKHIAIVTVDGENLSPDLKTSIETEMHLAIYRERPDIMAVVHAHPVYASLFTAIDRRIRTDILAEARYLLGEPVFAPYALMGTRGLAESVGSALADPSVKVALMENHGVITVGTSLFQAYDRIEVLEAAAKMTLLGELAGGINTLDAAQLAAIDAL
jgi:L-fuculose-phosphate aldolase